MKLRIHWRYTKRESTWNDVATKSFASRRSASIAQPALTELIQFNWIWIWIDSFVQRLINCKAKTKTKTLWFFCKMEKLWRHFQKIQWATDRVYSAHINEILTNSSDKISRGVMGGTRVHNVWNKCRGLYVKRSNFEWRDMSDPINKHLQPQRLGHNNNNLWIN